MARFPRSGGWFEGALSVTFVIAVTKTALLVLLRWFKWF